VVVGACVVVVVVVLVGLVGFVGFVAPTEPTPNPNSVTPTIIKLAAQAVNTVRVRKIRIAGISPWRVNFPWDGTLYLPHRTCPGARHNPGHEVEEASESKMTATCSDAVSSG
jgi:hypothetical protein